MNKFQKKVLGFLSDITGLLKSGDKKSDSMIKLTKIQLVLTVIGLLVMGGILTIGFSLLPAPQKEYSYSVSVMPNSFLLNQTDPIDLKITFENTGTESLLDFKVFQMQLCRFEIDNYRCQEIFTQFNNNLQYWTCTGSVSGTPTYPHFEFKSGEKCSIEIKHISLDNKLFDDREKPVSVYVSIDSKPPLENKKVDLKIS